jgi:hypothetical protein
MKTQQINEIAEPIADFHASQLSLELKKYSYGEKCWIKQHILSACWKVGAKAIAEVEKEKPCYCLGRHTIEQVANESALQTDKVDFIAASDLYAKNPYALIDQLRKVAADLAFALAKTFECHTCEDAHKDALTAYNNLNRKEGE